MKIFFTYITIISVISVLITVFDKIRAMKHGRRIRERTLILLSAFGGSAAMLITMLVIRHKTRHIKFMLGIPLIILFQILAFFLWRIINGS